MIDLDAEEVLSAMKIINVDIEVFAEKTMIALVFEIDDGSIHKAMTLMNQHTVVLLPIIVLGSKIQCLRIVLFPLVCRLVDIVTEDEYL